MLRFGKIISEIGYNSVEDFSKLAEIPVCMYDRKNRVIGEESFDFGHKLFSEKPDSKMKFQKLVENLTKSDTANIKISGRLTDNALILYINGFIPHFFFIF